MRTLIKDGDLSLVITVRSAAAKCVSRRKVRKGHRGKLAARNGSASRVQDVEKYGFIHARPCLCNRAYVTQRA